MLRYRVYYGYKPCDYIAIAEDDLERALYAWKTGAIFQNKLNGNNIQRIEEDFRYYTGWYDSYSPSTGEDEAQMRRDMPSMSEFRERTALASRRVEYVIRNNAPNLLSEPSKLDVLALK